MQKFKFYLFKKHSLGIPKVKGNLGSLRAIFEEENYFIITKLGSGAWSNQWTKHLPRKIRDVDRVWVNICWNNLRHETFPH